LRHREQREAEEGGHEEWRGGGLRTTHERPRRRAIEGWHVQDGAGTCTARKNSSQHARHVQLKQTNQPVRCRWAGICRALAAAAGAVRRRSRAVIKTRRPENPKTAVSSFSTSNAHARPVPLARCRIIMTVDVSGGGDVVGRVLLHCKGTLSTSPCFTFGTLFHILWWPMCGRICHQTSPTGIIIHQSAVIFVFIRLLISLLLF
jgi:hypothetical protein